VRGGQEIDNRSEMRGTIVVHRREIDRRGKATISGHFTGFRGGKADPLKQNQEELEARLYP